MKYFEYLSAKRKEKLSLLERQNVVSAAAFKKEKEALSESYITLRKAELAAAIKETAWQADCSHDFSSFTVSRSPEFIASGERGSTILVMSCKKCGLVKKERL